MFEITQGKGFKIEFPNGITLSTQFGGMNYGDNHNKEISNLDSVKAKKVEIAIWDKSWKWITKEAIKDILLKEKTIEDVVGYVVVEKWLLFFDWARNYKPITEKKQNDTKAIN